MEKMVNVYFFGKKYSVPADLTIMTAMEYAGYYLKRGCGCARILRRLRHDLQDQGKERTEDRARLSDPGGRGHVCGKYPLFPHR